MSSYINFRDVGAVLTAGNGLAAAGAPIGDAVTARVASLTEGAKLVLKQRDDYGTGFWNDTYHAVPEGGDKPRDTLLLESAQMVADAAGQIGTDVVQAVSNLVGVDAMHGAAMYRVANTTQ